MDRPDMDRPGVDKPYIYVAKNDEIATVYINRTQKRNAFTLQMWQLLHDIVSGLREDRDAKVVVFRSVDRSSFAAGADIGEFKTLRSTAPLADRYNRFVIATEQAIRHLPKPTIAMIQGYCVGGGMGIALACDFRFSDPSGKFGITPAKLGIVYDTAATRDLVLAVGSAHARDILFTGRLVEADEALRMGLIQRVYDASEIERSTFEYARTICRCSQVSVRGSKTIIRKVLEGQLDDDAESEELVLKSFESEDYQEGVSAFLEKRAPRFQTK